MNTSTAISSQSFKASKEYSTSAFILTGKDAVVAPQKDTRFGFSRVKSLIVKVLITLLLSLAVFGGVNAIPKLQEKAYACSGMDIPCKINEAVDNIKNVATDGVKNIFCGAGNANGAAPESAYASFGSMMSPAMIVNNGMRNIDNLGGKPQVDGSKPYTAYEKYGISGTNFTFNRDKIDGVQEYDCFPVGKLFMTLSANVIFTITEVITMFAAWIYGFAVGTTAFDGTIKSIATVLGNGSDGGIIQMLYLNYLTPIIMIGILWVGWWGIVKRAFTVAGSGLIWMVVAVGAGLGLMYNSSGIIGFSNGIVQSVVNQTTGVIGGITADKSGSKQNSLPDPCSLPGGQDKVISGKNSKNVERMVGCRVWQAFVYYPWATGEFGMPPTQETLRGGDVNTKINFGNGNVKNMDIRMAQLDAQSIDYSLPMMGDATVKGLQAKKENYDKINKFMTSDPKGKSLANTWAGNDGQSRLSIAVFSVVAAIGGTIIIISVSGSLIIYQLGTIFLFLVSPFFLLLGVHPGFGKGMALKWLEMLVETVLKRIVLGIFISIIISIFMFLVTNSEATGYMSTLFLLVALSIAALMYKNKFLNLVSALNFGGTQTGMEGSKDATKSKVLGAVGAVAGGATGLMGGTASAVGQNAAAAATARGASAAAAKKAGRKAVLGSAAKSTFAGAGAGSTGQGGFSGATRGIIGGHMTGQFNKNQSENDLDRAMMTRDRELQAQELAKKEEDRKAKLEAQAARDTQRAAERQAGREADTERWDRASMDNQTLHGLTRGIGQILLLSDPTEEGAQARRTAADRAQGGGRRPASSTVNSSPSARKGPLSSGSTSSGSTSRGSGGSALPPSNRPSAPKPPAGQQPLPGGSGGSGSAGKREIPSTNSPTPPPSNTVNGSTVNTTTRGNALEEAAGGDPTYNAPRVSSRSAPLEGTIIEPEERPKVKPQSSPDVIEGTVISSRPTGKKKN